MRVTWKRRMPVMMLTTEKTSSQMKKSSRYWITWMFLIMSLESLPSINLFFDLSIYLPTIYSAPTQFFWAWINFFIYHRHHHGLDYG